jgi:hypothetical protein
METKVCTKCKVEKLRTDFNKHKNKKDGLNSSCKECRKVFYQINKEKINESRKDYQKQYRENNKEKLKEYRENNKDIKKVYNKNYRENNKEKLKDYKKTIKYKEHSKNYWKIYYKNNKEKIIQWNKEWHKTYYKNNKEKINEKAKIYNQNNKEKINERAKIYTKKRIQYDPLFKLSKSIRTLIGNGIRNNSFKKNTKTQLILGCSIQELKLYLESQFQEWMNWDNYGNPKDKIFDLNKTWDIDHIIPLSSAKTEEEVIKLNHYSNLQPLCSYTNRNIKKDKIYNYGN